MEKYFKNILFGMLVVFVVIFMFFFLFPRTNNIYDRLDSDLSYVDSNTFSNNMNIMVEASYNYFNSNSDAAKVTLDELINGGYIDALSDGRGEMCDSLLSYATHNEHVITNYLKCSSKSDTVIKSIGHECFYIYKKDIKQTYSDWSDWSEWSTNIYTNDDLRMVESHEDTVNHTRMDTVYADYIKKDNVCDNGYVYNDGVCKKIISSGIIPANVSYICQDGYTRAGKTCINGNDKYDAVKKLFCPNDSGNITFKLNGNECDSIIYDNSSVTDAYTVNECPRGFNSSKNGCFKEVYGDTVSEHVTYYRYKTRNLVKGELDVIINSDENDNALVEKGYNNIGNFFCK